jgi:hypothetical protein
VLERSQRPHDEELCLRRYQRIRHHSDGQRECFFRRGYGRRARQERRAFISSTRDFRKYPDCSQRRTRQLDHWNLGRSLLAERVTSVGNRLCYRRALGQFRGIVPGVSTTPRSSSRR